LRYILFYILLNILSIFYLTLYIGLIYLSLWLIYLAVVVDILFDVVDILDTLWLIYLTMVWLIYLCLDFSEIFGTVSKMTLVQSN
jgi:hypothetical protein